MQAESKEIILSCPGGKCPIKISCVTHLRKDATTAMQVPPFSQTGVVVRCTYFKLKEYERRVSETITEHQVEQKEKSVEQDKAISGEEKSAIQTVAPDQGQLFK